jgi:ATP-binding cassette subfamily F protein 3
MLRLILGQEKPLEGVADIPSSRVIMNYYAQNSADSLVLEDTIYETIANDPAIDLARYQASRKQIELDESAAMIDIMNEIRTLLAQFCFSKDDIYKKIHMLSGGEKARVALCKMMLTPANLLVLDEVKISSLVPLVAL